MQELKTKFGTLYFEAAHISEDFLYVLLDSDKEFITNIYHRDDLYQLEKMTYLDDLFDIIGERGFYAHSLESLVVELNEYLENEKRIFDIDFVPFTLDELKDNEYVNHIGDYYIFFLD